jgi:hypothetical protein
MDNGTGNSILSNSIHSNGTTVKHLGIDLGADLNTDGVTPNDAGDGDTGANNLQNFPVITMAVSTAGTTNVQGTLNSTPDQTFNLQFFSNQTCDAAGNGEGQTFLGSTSVTTDANGNASFNTTLATATSAGQFVTATATDAPSNTSEFRPVRPSPVCSPARAARADGGVVSGRRQRLDIQGGNHGTLQNGATFAAGKVNSAFSLNGNGGRIVVGNPAALQLQDFTIDAWVKRASSTVVSNNRVRAWKAAHSSPTETAATDF